MKWSKPTLSAWPPVRRYLWLAPFLLGLTLPVQAQPVEALSKCVVENTTVRDRKDLAKWVFVAIGAHPEMKAITTLPRSASEQASRAAGRIFTRLITEACAKEARAAIGADGPEAIGSAFAALGAVAMQEIMTDKDVKLGISSLGNYVDIEKVESVLGGK